MNIAAMSLLCAAALSLFAADAPAAEALRAFRGAEGWGAATPGGRGGQTIWVTNLGDSGPGSLREALETRGARTILFGVSGVIHLKQPLTLGDRRNPRRADELSFVTVAGHSAPGGGVTVADRTLVIGGGVHDVVIRHVRFRNSDGDGVSFNHGARRVILDHCSISWSTDENMGFNGDNQEITFQHGINAECLHHGGHHEGAHSKGFLISRGANRVSLHHNYIAGNVDRNALFVGNNSPDRYERGERHPIFDMRNNLIYNCDAQTKLKFGARANIVANHYEYGPRNSRQTPILFLSDEEGSQAWLSGNLSSKHGGDPWELASAQTSGGLVYAMDVPSQLKADVPFAAPEITTVAADQVAGHVLAGAGALPRDEADQRLIREFLTGAGSCGAMDRTHDSPVPSPAQGTAPEDADKDGMHDAWERAHGLDPHDALDGQRDRNGDGYTNLEEYLDEVAAQLERDERAWYETAAEQAAASSNASP